MLFPGGTDEADEGGAAEEEDGGGEEEPGDRPAQEGAATTGSQSQQIFSLFTPLLQTRLYHLDVLEVQNFYQFPSLLVFPGVESLLMSIEIFTPSHCVLHF